MTPTHDSIRGWFAAALHDEMEKNDKIWLITADLGWGMWDAVRDDFPERFINVGAAEQAAVGAGIGLALSGKIPFVYSITTFLLYRAFEWHINYLNHEKVAVRLVGSGYEYDYEHDGKTHQPHLLFGMEGLLETQLYNVRPYFPVVKEDVPIHLKRMVSEDRPSFICLRR